MEITIQVVGLFFGVFMRTWVPYARKLKQGKIEKFDWKFLQFAIGSFILSAVTVILLIPEYNLATGDADTAYAGIKMFATAFSFGFAWNSVINEAAKWIKSAA